MTQEAKPATIQGDFDHNNSLDYLGVRHAWKGAATASRCHSPSRMDRRRLSASIAPWAHDESSNI